MSDGTNWRIRMFREGDAPWRLVLLFAAAVLAVAFVPGCASSHGNVTAARSAKPTAGPSPPTAPSPSAPPTSTPPTAPPQTASATTSMAIPAPPTSLGPGSAGPGVLALQQRLASLGYWLGSADGTFGDTTTQAVYALQKAAGIGHDGFVGPATNAALAQGVVPHPKSTSGRVIEVDLEHDLLMFVTNGKVDNVLNTSTGGGYRYTEDGTSAVANTPVGHFQIYREVDGMVTNQLGQLWRPRFFDSGFAIHGDSYVPPVPVSHGCVRVSNEAINWVWSNSLAPNGTPVWVY